jgi:pyruvate,water dikinase
MDLYVIDLGGGLDPPARGTRIKPGHVTSLPLQALLRGLLDRRLQRWGPRPIDVGGLLGIIARHAFSSPENERTFRDPCYALVSDQYLNYTARVGYHFGVVDTFCSPAPNRNYVSFRFRGGAADRSRRQRRAQAIGFVLRELGFTVETAGDAVRARLSKATRDETLEQLEHVGRLLQFFRQMDAAMASDEAADHLTHAFLKGDFDLTRQGGADPPGA